MKYASPEQDAKAKLFEKDPKLAQVYLFRAGPMGFGKRMPVSINGKFIGNTLPDTYYKFTLNPGQYTFRSQVDYSELTVKLEPNKIYYIWQEGIYPDWSNLMLVEKEEATKYLRDCELLIPDYEVF